jgi:hypothetical protein
MYILDKDGQLNDTAKPWAFANVRYWAAHRHWDLTRKRDSLEFLKKKGLIGRTCSTKGTKVTELEDVIKLDKMNFDDIQLAGSSGNLYQLDMKCIQFNQVSLTNVSFSYVDLDGSSFDGSRLDGVTFGSSSLIGASFNGTDLHDIDFGNSDLEGTQFSNVNLSTAILNQEQINQALFHNTILPNEKMNKSTMGTQGRSIQLTFDNEYDMTVLL